MDNIALTLYKHPESALNNEEWQEGPQRVLLPLLLHSTLSAAAAPSADSSSEAVIHSIPLQFQPQHQKRKAPT